MPPPANGFANRLVADLIVWMLRWSAALTVWPGVAATVRVHGPAQALRDEARALELMASEIGQPDEMGPMRRTAVEYLGD